jgi:hypothetical protein
MSCDIGELCAEIKHLAGRQSMIENVYAHLTPSDAYDALLKAFASDRDG